MRSLQLEDGILAAWNLAAVPLLASGATSPLIALGGEPSTLAGIIQLLAVAGAIAAIATRQPSRSLYRDEAGALAPLAFVLIGPLIGAVAFVAGSASTHLGIAVDGIAVGVAFVAIVAAMAFGDRLPVIDATLRRVLVLPFILVAAGMFNTFAADLLGSVELTDFTDPSFAEYGGLIVLFGIMLIGGLAAFYAALVAAPRTLADPSLAGWWPLRFALFVVSAVLGIGWLSVLSG